MSGWSFNGGAFQHNMISLTKDKTAKADFAGETYIPLGLEYSFQTNSGWRFSPALNFTHLTTAALPKKTPEKGATKNLIFINLPMVTNLTSWLDGKVGLGYFQYEVKGKGGTVDLPNGTGTSTFYQPSQTRTSKNVYFLLGAAFPMTGWQIDFDLLVNGAASNDRRSYSMYLYLNYPLGGRY